MEIVAGVDCGNSKTVAVVCDMDGVVRGVARGGGANWEWQGEQTFVGDVGRVVDRALELAKAKRMEVLHLHCGAAGIDWPEDEERLAQVLGSDGWQGGVSFENDSLPTVRGCSLEGWGIAVMAGAGICAGIILPDGRKYAYGGFTDLGGESRPEGRAFQAVVRAEDGRGPATALTDALLEATGCASAWQLVHDAHRRRCRVPGEVLNRTLFAVAGRGDPVAVGILTDFGRELALCATNLIRRYGLADEELPVVAAGSRFTKTGPLLFDTFRREVLAVAPKARLILAQHEPALGAVRGALAALGRDTEEVWAEVLRSSTKIEWSHPTADGDEE